MDWTTSPCFVPVAFLLTITAAGPAASKDTLSVVADTPLVSLTPRNRGRNFVRLPALDYQFEIQTNCSDGRGAVSLSLNVADTRKSLAAGQIVGDGPTEISLRIPSSQIAPLVIEDFCVAQPEGNDDENSEAPTQITIPAALSAQASLLCAGEVDKAITYVSRTLDVALVCEPVTSGDDTEEE